jgi:pimeloyl-ACP methyl ester carboxylesterase
MGAEQNDFEFLATDARRMSVSSLPRVVRESLPTPQGELSALVFGSEPPVATFLHGAGLNAHTFDPVILALNVPAVSIDLPGHGRSQWRDDADYRPAQNAVALADALSGLKTPQQILVGHSLGGLSALKLVAEHPALVRHLVLLDITPGVTPDDGGSAIREFIAGQKHFETVEDIIDRAIAFNIGHDREALRRGITLNTRTRSDGMLEWTHHLAHLLTPGAEESATSPFSQSNAGGYSALWQDARVIIDHEIPITLIRGNAGMVSDELVKQWQSYLPESAVHTVEAGHNVQEHNPQELAALLRELLVS